MKLTAVGESTIESTTKVNNHRAIDTKNVSLAVIEFYVPARQTHNKTNIIEQSIDCRKARRYESRGEGSF